MASCSSAIKETQAVPQDMTKRLHFAWYQDSRILHRIILWRIIPDATARRNDADTSNHHAVSLKRSTENALWKIGLSWAYILDCDSHRYFAAYIYPNWEWGFSLING